MSVHCSCGGDHEPWQHQEIDVTLDTLYKAGYAAGRAEALGEERAILQTYVRNLPFLDVNTDDGGGGRMVALDAVLAALTTTETKGEPPTIEVEGADGVKHRVWALTTETKGDET